MGEQHFIASLLRVAAYGGSSQVFNYLLDHMVIITEGRGNSDYIWGYCWRDCQLATWNSAAPEDSRRAVQTLTSLFELDFREFEGGLPDRINCAVRNGRLEMLRHFLDEASSASIVALMIDIKDPRSRVFHTSDRTYHYMETDILQASALRNIAVNIALRKASGKHDAYVKLLLDYGTDPNRFSTIDTPLMRAVNEGCYTIVRTLVEHGADINPGTPPPITLAVRQENIEIFCYLRKRGPSLIHQSAEDGQ